MTFWDEAEDNEGKNFSGHALGPRAVRLEEPKHNFEVYILVRLLFSAHGN